MRSLLSLIVPLAVLGCVGGGDDPLFPAEVIAGTADPDGTGFLELPDGERAPLIPGSQGGFHVWVNVKVANLDAGMVRLEREARRDADDALILRAVTQPLEIPIDTHVEPWTAPAAVPAFMCPTPIGIRVEGEAVRYRVRLLDMEDTVLAEDFMVLVPTCEAGDQYDFCMSICTG